MKLFFSSEHLSRPLAQSLPGDIQHWNHENSDGAGRDHANEDRRAHIMSCNFGCAFRPDERQQTEDERDRCHHHGPKAHFRPQCSSLLDARSLLALLLGEFNDQDAILCRERNQDDQANLRIEVQFAIITPATAPRTPTTTDSRTGTGMIQLSYKATRNRKANNSASPRIIPVCP